MLRAAIDQDITPTDRLIDQLPADWEVSVGLGSTEAQVIADLDGVDVVFVTSRVPLTERVLDVADDLQIVAKLGTGLDSVAVDAARERGIEVTYTPGMNALSVAEHTLMLLLATARRLTEARNLIETDRWRDDVTLGTRVSGSTVGIVGFGNVGKRVGTLLRGFDVDVLLHDPYTAEIDRELVGGQYAALDDVLSASDFVCITAELTPETRGLIGPAAFDAMDDSTILVNTARGPVVDEAALLDALQSGDLGGAGLDVHHTEPLGSDSPFLDMENVVLTPHIASMTAESRADTIDRLAENVRLLRGDDRLPDRYRAQ